MKTILQTSSATLRYLLVTMLVAVTGSAQQQSIRFSQLNNANKLSQNWVHAICQDKYGFIWIGTEDGLNRYDGYDFVVYKHDRKNPYSLTNSAINSLFIDSKGNLWVGTSRGLNLYDRANDRFIRHAQLNQVLISSFAEDANGNLWVGTNQRLFCINLTTDSMIVYESTAPVRLDAGSLSSNVVQALHIDSKKNIWIGSNFGVNILDTKKNTIINYYHDESDPHSIMHNDVRSIVEDKAGRIWIGTRAGLDMFTYKNELPSKAKFTHFKNNPNNQNSITAGLVLSLLVEKTNKLFIGIENGGLDVLDLSAYNKGKILFTHNRNNPNKVGGIGINSIYSLYQDKQGIIWIGTFGKGINVISPEDNKFTTVAHEINNENSLSNNNVNTFFEEKDYLWIGTEGGLNRYEKRTGTFKHYIHNPSDPSSIGSNAVWTIRKDRQGNLWVGTWGGGLNLFNYKTEKFTRFTNDPQYTNSIGSDNIFSIFEDNNGKLWIGTMGNGLNMFDPVTKKFIRYSETTSNISSNYVQSVIETKKGEIWLTNILAVEHFNKSTGLFEHFQHNEKDTTSLSGIRPLWVFEDSKENLWVGTDDGLNLLNKSKTGFIHFRTEDGLPSNFVVSITEDNNGNLWIGTNKGLSKFVNAVNLPPQPEFMNYTADDGLQANEFVRRSSFKGLDGRLYFGGVNGFNVFAPEKITTNTFVPPVLITGFHIFNKPAAVGAEDSPLKKNIILTNEIVLSYKHSVFSFDFVALNYSFSARNQYAYMMEGFDREWNYVGEKRTATYTNLDPGEYTFKVKGSNNDDVWNEQGTSLHIIITPPFWQTIWFKIIIAIILLYSAFFTYKRWVHAREIAERMRLDEAIAKERNLLRTLIDNVPDYVYVKDTEGRFIIGNTATVRQMGFNNEKDILGKTDFDFFPRDLAEKYAATEQEILHSGKGIQEYEGPTIDPTKDAKDRWVSTTKVPFKDSQGNILGTVGIGRDITERKRIEEEREILIRDLQKALADVKTLSGLVPICSNCKKIRDDSGFWNQLESYIQKHSHATFSHGICPECMKRLYPDVNIKIEPDKG